jgi:hypothetical protein
MNTGRQMTPEDCEDMPKWRVGKDMEGAYSCLIESHLEIYL